MLMNFWFNLFSFDVWHFEVFKTVATRPFSNQPKFPLTYILSVNQKKAPFINGMNP